MYTHMATRRSSISKFIKNMVFRRQKGKCACCGNNLGVAKDLDHRKPIRCGGTNSPKNLQYLCCNCHRHKTILDNRCFKKKGKRAMKCTQCNITYCTFFVHVCDKWKINIP